jgi:hypothetical protein
MRDWPGAKEKGMYSRRLALVISLFVFLALSLALTGPAAAGTLPDLNLDDQNSHVVFNPVTGIGSWQVETIEQLKRQWFYYRIDGMTQEVPLYNLGYFNGKTVDADYDDGKETLNAIYGDPATFSVILTYVLSGGLDGTHKSDLQETITLNNKTGRAVHIQFFQYCDCDLGGTADDDTVFVANPNAVVQRDANLLVAETVVTPVPARTEVALYASTLGKLLNGDVDILDNSKGPVSGDVTWAFQWDVTVPAGGTVQISKDKNIVPEPATLALMGGGLLVALVVRRKR